MAGKAKPGDDAAAADERETQRVVLSRVRAIVLPPTLTAEQTTKIREAIAGARVRAVSEEDAWIVVGEYAGATKDDAIEAYAGKAGTPDAKVGVFKAPGLRAWRGGAVYDAPPLPLVERRALED